MVAVRAVIFDWGGTLTPWHGIDHDELWLAVCSRHYPADEAAGVAAAVRAVGGRALAAVRDLAPERHAGRGVRAGRGDALGRVPGQLLRGVGSAYADRPGRARRCCATCARRGVKVGVLSNTMWPRAAHEQIFARDGVLELIDGAVYTSEIPWVKPHPEAFRAAMRAIGVADAGSCVFVGDRPYDDMYGAKGVGMRAVLIPNSDVPAFGGAAPDAVITRLAELPGHLDGWEAC